MLILEAPVTILLLLGTVAISIAAFRDSRIAERFLLSTEGVLRRRQYYRVVTSGFLHGDPMHLFMNMLTLFFFGPFLELGLGPVNFLLIYFASMLAGSALALTENFRNPRYRALGASGAISGAMIVFALFQPFAMILFFFIPMPAVLFAVLFIGYSAMAAGRAQDGIGHDAHLGGALMGLTLVCVLWPSQLYELVDEARGFIANF